MKLSSNQIKLSIGVFVMLVLNVVFQSILVPYTEQAVRKHSQQADIVTIFSVVTSLLLFFLGMSRLYKDKSSITGYFILTLSANFLYWFNILREINCTSCSIN